MTARFRPKQDVLDKKRSPLIRGGPLGVLIQGMVHHIHDYELITLQNHEETNRTTIREPQ